MCISSAILGLALLLSLQVLSTASLAVNNYSSIKREQRCNFIKDLSNGEDERACGACQFQGSDPRQECGLELWADETVHWSWFEMPADLLAQAARQRVAVRGTLKLNIAATDEMARREEISRLATPLTRRAGIYFPHYRPTDATNCKFTYTAQLAPIEGELMQQNRVVIKTILVVARDRNTTTQTENDLSELHLLDTLTLTHQEGEQVRAGVERSVAINSAQMNISDWTIAMLAENLVKTKNESDNLLFELADFKFSGCEPSAAFQQANIVELKQKSCSPNQFTCRLSGQCIGEDYRCDFGPDCGPFDFSDEHNCPRDLYQGRCDFERGPEWCNWLEGPVRGLSWLWASDEPTNRRLAQHELIDVNHTQGHFMLANMNYQRSLPFAQVELLGPRVYLRTGHSMCHFRFWARNTTKYSPNWLVINIGERKASLLESITNFKHIWTPATYAEKSRPYWRRFQVPLIDGSKSEEAGSFDRLRLSIHQEIKGNEPEAKYFALDDFSFSPGCGLAHHEQLPLTSVCRPDEFVCTQTLPDQPDQVCLPANRVCDFKNDCGPDPMLNLQASDEAHCKSSFDFSEGDFKMSGTHLSEYGSWLPYSPYQSKRADAFRVEVHRGYYEMHEPLKIVAQQTEFSKAFNTTAGHAYSTESGFVLPRFNQAHANCSLQIFYAWQEADNLSLNIYLIQSASRRLVLRHHKKSNSSAKSLDVTLPLALYFLNGDMETMEVGIGQQDKPFNIHIEIAAGDRYRGDGRHDVRLGNYQGEFHLSKYKFVDCSYPDSRLARSPRLEIHDSEEIAEYEEIFRYLMPDAVRLTGGPPVNLTCPAGHFQCGQPVLCLPEQFVCDMQQDCQESNADELDCAARGYLQFDFESDLDKLGLKKPGLVVSQTYKGAYETHEAHYRKWATRTSWGLQVRNKHGVGPAMDHTRRSTRSRFLTFASHPPDHVAEMYPDARNEATLTLGQFKVTNSCQRLVVYVHVWPEPPKRTLVDSAMLRGGDTNATSREIKSLEYEIRFKYYNSERGTEPIENGTWTYPGMKLLSPRDGWQRFEGPLPHTYSNLCASCSQATHFTISFWSAVTVWPGMERPLVAFDDLVLGPKCELIQSQVADVLPTVKRVPNINVKLRPKIRIVPVQNVSAPTTQIPPTNELSDKQLQVIDRSRSSAKWFLGTFALACAILVALALSYRAKQARKMASDISSQDVQLECKMDQTLESER